MAEPIEPIQIAVEKDNLVHFVRFAKRNNFPIWKMDKKSTATVIEKALDSPVLIEALKTVRELATPTKEVIIDIEDIDDAEFDIPPTEGEGDGEEEE